MRRRGRLFLAVSLFLVAVIWPLTFGISFLGAGAREEDEKAEAGESAKTGEPVKTDKPAQPR